MSNETDNQPATARADSPAPTGYAPVLVVPTNTPAEVLEELRAAGYVPVTASDPSKVVVITPCSRIIGDDLLMSAMHGLAGEHASNERSRMMLELFRRMKAREAHTDKLSV
jgi:hypothetical protein